jgi:hypothetical protein
VAPERSQIVLASITEIAHGFGRKSKKPEA